MNFSAAFEKKHEVSILLVRMVDIIVDMVSSNFQTSNISHTNQRYIRVAKVPSNRPDTLNIIENIDEEKMGSRTLDISHVDSDIHRLWT